MKNNISNIKSLKIRTTCPAHKYKKYEETTDFTAAGLLPGFFTRRYVFSHVDYVEEVVGMPLKLYSRNVDEIARRAFIA